MVGITVAAKNALLDSLGINQVSLHTADPGETGANEVTGGTYAKKAITMDPAALGNLNSQTVPVLDVPAGTTITHVGFWAGATFKVGVAITAETFASAGTYTLSDADIDLNK